MKKTPIYSTWRTMRERCNNPNAVNYDRYGGRGIKVCERWSSFENFYADMGDRPFPRAEIDRIDNDGDYEPGNCRWATRSQNGNNTSANRAITFRGKTQNIVQWAKEFGLSYPAVYQRLKLGWSIEKALTTPLYGAFA